MRKTSSETGEPWCAPTREVESAHLVELVRKTRRSTGQQPLAPGVRYQLATLEDRDLADGSTPDMVDPFATPSRVTTVVVPAPVQVPEQGKTWALVLAIVLMLATAAGVGAIVFLM